MVGSADRAYSSGVGLGVGVFVLAGASDDNGAEGVLAEITARPAVITEPFGWAASDLVAGNVAAGS